MRSPPKPWASICAHHKRMAFVISSFFAGISGALLAMYQTTVQANTFKSAMTYEILLIVVIGGMGSVLRAAASARFCSSPAPSGGCASSTTKPIVGAFKVPLLRTGFRMVVFSIVIMIVVLFFRKGIMGDREISLAGLAKRLTRKSVKGGETGMSTPVLHVEHVTMQFGGVVAVNDLSHGRLRRRDRRADRPEWRRQDHGLQLHHRRLRADQRRAWTSMGEPIVCNHPARQDEKASTRARARRMYLNQPVVSHTPDKSSRSAALPVPSRTSACSSRMTVFENVLIAMHVRRTSNVFSATFRRQPQRGSRPCANGHMELLEDRGAGRRQGRAGDRPALRQTAPAGDRPRAGDGSEAAAARRAGRRHEPAGDRSSWANFIRSITRYIRSDHLHD